MIKELKILSYGINVSGKLGKQYMYLVTLVRKLIAGYVGKFAN